MSYQERLPEIEALVRETFLLWDERRVGFSWRHYYMNHTLRVRALALELGKREGADLDVVAFAATLHDITKRYDGAIATSPDGKRLVDANGFWINQTLPPARQNRATRLYDSLALGGQMHHVSGATLAAHLLAEEGFPAAFQNAVADAIRAHVRGEGRLAPEAEALCQAPEARALYDADLIDANLGLVAFYRNIQIHAGRAVQQAGRVDPHVYVGGIARWVDTKDPFIPRLLTPSGRAVATERQERNRQVAAWVAEESAVGAIAWQYGVLGIIAYFLEGHEDPSLSAAQRGLREEWLPARRSELAANGESADASTLLARARHFSELLEMEVDGRA